MSAPNIMRCKLSAGMPASCNTRSIISTADCISIGCVRDRSPAWRTSTATGQLGRWQKSWPNWELEPSGEQASTHHHVLNPLHRPHVVGALKRARIGTTDLAHAALQLLHGFVFVVLHPLFDPLFKAADVIDPVSQE